MMLLRERERENNETEFYIGICAKLNTIMESADLQQHKKLWRQQKHELSLLKENSRGK